jgi:hypothetical protein
VAVESYNQTYSSRDLSAQLFLDVTIKGKFKIIAISKILINYLCNSRETAESDIKNLRQNGSRALNVTFTKCRNRSFLQSTYWEPGDKFGKIKSAKISSIPQLIKVNLTRLDLRK